MPLTLIPTPIDSESKLNEEAFSLLDSECLKDSTLILVEEHKECRRKWLHFGLPREAIDKFILYNEHTRGEILPSIISELASGKNAYLMSDCGLPAFCDPGMMLVSACHDMKIKVTSTPFFNSVSLALALSGLAHKRFIFEGFVSKGSERNSELKRIMKNKETTILMDTPYRMNKLVEELASINPNRVAFLGMDLNQKSELLLRESLSKLLKLMPQEKREFILILDEL